MRKQAIPLAAAIAIIAWSGSSLAFENANGVGYFALQVPNPEKMVIDGYDDDWDWFDPQYVILRDQMVNFLMQPVSISKEDWDATVMVGWSAPGQGGEGYENMWYVFAKVTDDTLDHDITDPEYGFNDDDMGFSTDMDASGGPFPDRIHAQQWTFHLATGGYPHVAHLRYKLPPEMQWGCKPPYCEAACRVEPEDAGHLATNVAVTYELKLAAWDVYQPEGPDASTPHMMMAGETVPAIVFFTEADGEWEDEFATGHHHGANGADAGKMSTFTLLGIGEHPSPTAVDPSSWGAIKALFGAR